MHESRERFFSLMDCYSTLFFAVVSADLFFSRYSISSDCFNRLPPLSFTSGEGGYREIRCSVGENKFVPPVACIRWQDGRFLGAAVPEICLAGRIWALAPRSRKEGAE